MSSLVNLDCRGHACEPTSNLLLRAAHAFKTRSCSRHELTKSHTLAFLARNQESTALAALQEAVTGAAAIEMRHAGALLLVGASVTGLVAPRPRTNPWTARRATGDAGFSLDGVRDSLIRQEETIIFALIERAQYARNAEIYDRDAYSCLLYTSPSPRD